MIWFLIIICSIAFIKLVLPEIWNMFMIRLARFWGIDWYNFWQNIIVKMYISRQKKWEAELTECEAKQHYIKQEIHALKDGVKYIDRKIAQIERQRQAHIQRFEDKITDALR